MYMQKIVVHVLEVPPDGKPRAGPTTETLPLPCLVGGSETIPAGTTEKALEIARRHKVLTVGPTCILVGPRRDKVAPQTTVLPVDSPRKRSLRIAGKAKYNAGPTHRWFCKLIQQARSHIPLRFAAMKNHLWDLTILYNSAWTPDHVDECEKDGPGHLVMNLVFNGTGWMIFCGEVHDTAKFLGVLVVPGVWTMFTDELRYEATHQVLRMEDSPVALTFQSSAPPAHVRIVVTARFGECPKEWVEKYKAVTAQEGDCGSNEVQVETAKLTPKAKPAAKLTPRRSSGRTSTTTRTPKAGSGKVPRRSPATSHPSPDPKASELTLNPSSHWQFDCDGKSVIQIAPNAWTVARMWQKKNPARILEPGLSFVLPGDNGTYFQYTVVSPVVMNVSRGNTTDRAYVVYVLYRASEKRQHSRLGKPPEMKFGPWSEETIPLEAIWLCGDAYIDLDTTAADPETKKLVKKTKLGHLGRALHRPNFPKELKERLRRGGKGVSGQSPTNLGAAPGTGDVVLLGGTPKARPLRAATNRPKRKRGAWPLADTEGTQPMQAWPVVGTEGGQPTQSEFTTAFFHPHAAATGPLPGGAGGGATPVPLMGNVGMLARHVVSTNDALAPASLLTRAMTSETQNAAHAERDAQTNALRKVRIDFPGVLSVPGKRVNCKTYLCVFRNTN